MTLKKEKIKKTFRFILPMFAIGALVASNVPTKAIQAEDAGEKLNVYEVSVSKDNLLGDLKEQVITNYVNADKDMQLDQFDMDRSTLDISGLNTTVSGLQTVTLKVNLINADASNDNVGYSFTEEAAVNMKIDTAPRLVLKSESVTVNNGDTFNPESYIGYINDDDNTLPALKVDSNVDMSVDGDYSVTYTAIDKQGNKTVKTMNVAVRTPQEVLDAIAAAEAEAAAQAAAEEEARLRAQREAQAAYAANVEFAGTGGIQGSGANPYSGGFANCTAGAWLLAAQYSGVYLPNFGNAGQWLGSAQSYGYSTGSNPSAGSIVVMQHHVAYVTGVNGDGTINIEEGNYNGHYMARTISQYNDGTQNVLGYIYLN